MPPRRQESRRPDSPPAPRSTPRPFLKWAGGKGQLLAQLWPLLPERFERYLEPFMGGAALFFALRPRRAVLTDVNPELVDCYRAVRDDVGGVIACLREHRYDKAHFYATRSVDPGTLPLAERAARTIFLNRAGFNGLYRVNRSGGFNVPFGRYENPVLCDEPNLRACSAALSGVTLAVRDFTRIEAAARPGDFVYLDPPYVPVSRTSAFTSYAAGGFGWDEQTRLSEIFATLEQRGVRVMLSNSDAPALRPLYERYPMTRLLASRAINAVGARRGKVAELLVRSFR